MDTNFSLKENVTGLTRDVFKFVIDKNYDNFTSNYEMKFDISVSFYNDYIKNRKEVFLEDFKKVNFYDINLFEINNNVNLTDLQKTLYNFKLAIVDVIKQDGVLAEVKLSKTSASPPLTKKVANNKLDIKPTGRDYGLLFR